MSTESALLKHILSRVQADVALLKEVGHLDAGSADKISSLLGPAGAAYNEPANTTPGFNKDILRRATPSAPISAPAAVPTPPPAPAPQEPPKQMVKAIWPYNVSNEVR